MKKILVLTDFSDNAEQAAKSALTLAAQMKAGMLLFHSMAAIPVVPIYAGGAFVTETVSLFALESEEKLTRLASELQKIAITVPLETQNGEGGLGDNVKRLLIDYKIELVVLGAPAGGAIDHLLKGADTLDVISTSNRPVMIIPPKEGIAGFKRFVLATDYNKNDLFALRYLANWVAINDSVLDIVHIQVNDDNPLMKIEQKEVFEIYLSGLSYPEIHCHELRGKNALSLLNGFCQEKNVDVLAMVNYHHNFFSRLFGTSQTFKALHHLALPLLVFPAAFSDENY